MWTLEQQNIKISKSQKSMTIFKQNNEIISRINQLNKFQSKILGKQIKIPHGWEKSRMRPIFLDD